MKRLWIAGGLGVAIVLFAISGLLMHEKRNVQTEETSQDAVACAEDSAPAGDNIPTGDSVSGGDSVSENAVAGEDGSAPEGEEDLADSEYADLAIADVERYVNVRSIPGTDGEIVGKMYDGAVAHVLETAGENGDWFKVTSGSVEGYIKAEFFLYGEDAAAVIDAYVTRYAQVTAKRLNVRKEPDLSAKRIGYVDQGEKVKVLENLGEWIKVEYREGLEGYVASEYVILSEEFTYAKSIEEERAELARQRELEKREQTLEENTPENTQIAAEAGTESGATAVVTQAAAASNAELRTAIVAYAMQYLGNAYVHGGSSLAGGTDCSGFTCFIYADFGYSISRTPAGQLSSAGRSIAYSEIQPGDIICYTANGKSCTHVGLYIGDGQIIHAATPSQGVVIGNADYCTILGVKNVID